MQRLDPAIWALLEQTSRSFYTTLRLLPRAIRSQIGLAYLLARATDTIADTRLVAPEQRLSALRAVRERILEPDRPGGVPQSERQLAAFSGQQSSPAERQLLEHIEEVFAALRGFAAEDQQRMREVLAIIISGQELDVSRFAAAGELNIVALKSEVDLDDYTYRVAGCVGKFWTEMCRAHLFPRAPLDVQRLLENGTRFGRGLQWVNILRDVAADLRHGRCYLPANRLQALGLSPADLLDPQNETRLRPLYDSYLVKARELLGSGWDYTNQLPRRQVRLRLACAWPVLIGVRTLGHLRTGPVLDPGHRIKVSRAEVWRIVGTTLAGCVLPAIWHRQFERHARWCTNGPLRGNPVA